MEQRIPKTKSNGSSPAIFTAELTPCGEVIEAKILEYFKRNPHEELTIDDIAAKFGVDRTSAKTAAYRLSNRGDVVIHHVIRKASDADGGDA